MGRATLRRYLPRVFMDLPLGNVLAVVNEIRMDWKGME